MNTLAQKITQASIKVGALRPDKRNMQQNYDYISADKILERAGDALAEVGVVIFPSVTSEETVQADYTDSYGKAKSRFDCVVRFGMIVSDGETQIELPWCGRGNDYAVPDKAYYKAVTSGHKYFVMKLLNIGIGNEDGEHENAETPQAPQRAAADSKNDEVFDKPVKEQPRITDNQREQLYGIVREFYGPDEWEEQMIKLTKAVTKNKTDNPDNLLASEAARLIDGVQKKMAQVAAMQAA